MHVKKQMLQLVECGVTNAGVDHHLVECTCYVSNDAVQSCVELCVQMQDETMIWTWDPCCKDPWLDPYKPTMSLNVFIIHSENVCIQHLSSSNGSSSPTAALCSEISRFNSVTTFDTECKHLSRCGSEGMGELDTRLILIPVFRSKHVDGNL